MNTIKHIIPALCCIALLTSCVNHIDEETANATISFKISNYNQSEFEKSQSRAAISDVISHLSFCVFSKELEKIQEIKQVSSSTGFGTVKTTIPYGVYSITVVGHNNAKDAIISSPENISFEDAKISDTFCYSSSIDIDGETPATVSVALNRVIAKFELQATDAIPADVKTIEFKFSEGGNMLNGKTGKASSSIMQTKTIEIPSGYINTSNNKFVLYTFLLAEESNLTIEATAKSEAKEVLFSKTFSDVPMKINRITRYKGEFFKTGENINGNITINNEWLNDLERPF